jgi:hypothetical protein
MSKLYLAVSFVAGAAAGVAVSSIFLKQHYKQIADAEIESVKEEFSKERKIFTEKKETEIKAKVAKEKPDIMDYAKIIQKEGYTNYRQPEKSTKAEEDLDPYVISPLKFGEMEEYEAVTVKYYQEDRILTDDNDELIEKPEIVIPPEGLDDYLKDNDVIYVRNDILKIDYEIIVVLGSYDDTLAEKPYLNSARLTGE